MPLTRKQKETDTSRISTREQPAFETLFHQHWDRTCEVLYRLVGDWTEGEDLALETFIRLYQRPPKKDQNLGGWLDQESESDQDHGFTHPRVSHAGTE